uniref:Uncharacterized protein n=1 Tax=Rhizophora mucronata TaxID=61149 RepID=A0A2P2QH97_RHIMU
MRYKDLHKPRTESREVSRQGSRSGQSGNERCKIAVRI